jgi:HK97 family phage major capsid protein
MPALTTSHIKLPTEVAKEITRKAQETSTIQTLSASTPQLFKNVENILFTQEPEAEFVGEGAQKSSMEPKFTPVKGVPHKAQVTVRMSDEVRWADEDNQLGIIDAITDASSKALGRALDYGVYHAINPATGAAVDSMEALTAGANVVTATADASADLDSMVDKVNVDYDVTGIALSKAWANVLRKLRVAATGQRLYPEIPLNLKAGSLDGIACATSKTVNAPLASAATNVLAILGDFNLIKWGIIRDLGLEIIEAGDPDGQGDLKRLNQVAYRTEIVYSWCVLDPKGFAVLKAATA